MAKKGKAKNSDNKAKHNKLLKQKKKRISSKKELYKLRLRELSKRINTLE